MSIAASFARPSIAIFLSEGSLILALKNDDDAYPEYLATNT
jgi:hypothetical protein